MKAKPINRLELTRQKFGAKMYGDNPVKGSKSTPLDEPKSVGQQIIDGLKEAIEAERTNNHREGYSKCPSCGQETLRHDGSCTLCENCGYSKCG